VKKTCAFLALAVLLAGCGGCGEEQKPVDQAPPKQAEPPKAPPKQTPVAKPKAPPLTDAQWAGIKAAFESSRKKVKEADALKAEGDALVKSSGPAAANDTYVKAKQLYHDAVEDVSVWMDSDDLGGKFTSAQIEDYLGDYTHELKRWTTSMSELGKIHKDN